MRSSTPPVLAGLRIADPAGAWAAAGFAVHGGVATVGAVQLRFDGDIGGVSAWWFDQPLPDEVAGIPTLAPSLATALPPTGVAPSHGHPNGITALDHVVATTSDVDASLTRLASVGLRPRRVVDGVRGDGDAQVRYAFLLLGPAVLELVGPTLPEAPADGPAGAARISGLAFVAPNLDDLPEATGPSRPAVQPGRRIVTLRVPGISVPIAVLTPRVPRA